MGTKRKKTNSVKVTREEVTMPMRWPARMYCAETDTGAVILTGNHAMALMSAVGAAVRMMNPPKGIHDDLMEAVDILDTTFGIGICEECDGEDE